MPAPVGDRRVPPPCAPAQELVLPTQHQFSAPALELSGSCTPPSQRQLAPVCTNPEPQGRNSELFPQDRLGAFHTHSLKGLEHLWEFSSENHCPLKYTDTHTPTPAAPRDQWDLKYALNGHSRGDIGSPQPAAAKDGEQCLSEPAASAAVLATLATCVCPPRSSPKLLPRHLCNSTCGESVGNANVHL